MDFKNWREVVELKDQVICSDSHELTEFNINYLPQLAIKGPSVGTLHHRVNCPRVDRTSPFLKVVMQCEKQ